MSIVAFLNTFAMDVEGCVSGYFGKPLLETVSLYARERRWKASIGPGGSGENVILIPTLADLLPQSDKVGIRIAARTKFHVLQLSDGSAQTIHQLTVEKSCFLFTDWLYELRYGNWQKGARENAKNPLFLEKKKLWFFNPNLTLLFNIW